MRRNWGWGVRAIAPGVDTEVSKIASHTILDLRFQVVEVPRRKAFNQVSAHSLFELVL